MKYTLTIDSEEDYYEPIWGVISTLKFYQICFVFSKALNVDFTHQDAASKAVKSFKEVYDNNLIIFEKHVWFEEENNWSIEIIQNKKIINYENPINELSLFNESKSQKTLILLKEWPQVDYILKVQGEIPFFDIDKIRNMPGIQMILEKSIESFSEYDKIL